MPVLLHQASQLRKSFVAPGDTIHDNVGDSLPDMARGTYGKHFIRQWREFRGLSLRQLESRLESEPGGEPLVTYASLGRIERFLQPYSQPILEALAVALNTTPSALLEIERFIRFIVNS